LPPLRGQGPERWRGREPPHRRGASHIAVRDLQHTAFRLEVRDPLQRAKRGRGRSRGLAGEPEKRHDSFQIGSSIVRAATCRGGAPGASPASASSELHDRYRSLRTSRMRGIRTLRRRHPLLPHPDRGQNAIGAAHHDYWLFDSRRIGPVALRRRGRRLWDSCVEVIEQPDG